MGFVPLSGMGINDTINYIDYGMFIITIVQIRDKSYKQHQKQKKAHDNHRKNLYPEQGQMKQLIHTYN